MFTAHQIYDRNNTFNRILKRALTIVHQVSVRPSLALRASACLLSFEDVADATITPSIFERLTLDRNTERYRKAIQLARLIILNYSPDLRGGREHVIAILFDMNTLFERFVIAQLRRAAATHATHGLHISGQVSKRFWSSKHIRPDIVAEFVSASGPERVILDTKWKVPQNGQPSDDDLKQMYAYNLHFGGPRSVLLYPRAERMQAGVREAYAQSASLPKHVHACATFYIDLFDASNRLRRDIGDDLIHNVIHDKLESR
jgi:5-methylcytosine-specific restriction enzyme subunit McrC